MSRCYPFPPPGYEKKAQVADLGLPKKEKKHKDKDKKRKRRKDNEINGDLHDKDKHSNKIHSSQLGSEVLYGRNGSVVEAKTTAAAAAAVDRPSDKRVKNKARTVEDGLHLETPICQQGLYNKESKRNGKVDNGPLPILSRTSGTIYTSGIAQTPLSNNVESDKVAVLQRCTALWPYSDDQEWLFSASKHLQPKPKEKVEETRKRLEVWAEVQHLPSVNVYALPYVIPY